MAIFSTFFPVGCFHFV